MFFIIMSKIMALGFIFEERPRQDGNSADDDLEMALYYLRTLSNIFRWAPDAMWTVLARRKLSNFDGFEAVSALRKSYHSLYMTGKGHQLTAQVVGSDDDNTFQDFFLQVCLRCITSFQHSIQDDQDTERVTQLHRYALTVLHQVLLNQHAQPLSKYHLEDTLIDRMTQALDGPDPYIQILLLDVIYASLKLRNVTAEQPSSPKRERRQSSIDFTKSLRLSSTIDRTTIALQPPVALLKCLQAGLSSKSSRPVLDSWVNFLSECLPFYSDSIFQVLIPLVETLCSQVGSTFAGLQQIFQSSDQEHTENRLDSPEATLISLLNALEQVLATAHDRLLVEESMAQTVKSPEQPQGFFGSMFSSDAKETRSATANDRLTVLLAFQDTVRICFRIWSWGQGSSTLQDMASAASFNYTSLRMRNRARRLLEHLFAAETLECLETVIDVWRAAFDSTSAAGDLEVFNLLPALDGSRPKHTIPAIFNSLYSRTNPSALDPSRKSTLTISLEDTDVVIFLVDYARSLEDDAMDEIWQDCMTFLKDLLGNPFPHRQTLPSLLEFAAILGEKVDNTNFGEQRKMRRDLGVSAYCANDYCSLIELTGIPGPFSQALDRALHN